MRRAARTDGPHADIRDTLRKGGWYVHDCSRLGDGFPDLLIARGGRLLLVEIKDGTKPPSRRALTPAERRTHEGLGRAGVPVRILGSVEEATRL